MKQKISYNDKGIICLPSNSREDAPPFFEAADNSYYYNTVVHDRLGVSLFHFIPRKTITLEETMSSTNTYNMSFCMSEGMEFSFSETKHNPLYIERNESCIIAAGTQSCISTYEKGQEYRAVGISFEPSVLQGASPCSKCEHAGNTRGNPFTDFHRYSITPRAKSILIEMTGCQVCGGLRDLFMEAKALELIVLFFNEIICQRGNRASETSLSKEDMRALYCAKELLDKTYVHPLTLSQLSKKVYLNEYKLKAGFKQCFGQTVYGYILEKRMEFAKELIGQQRFKISDIAGLTGYENTSHFITAFQKQYGITPGKLAKGDITRSHEFSIVMN